MHNGFIHDFSFTANVFFYNIWGSIGFVMHYQLHFCFDESDFFKVHTYDIPRNARLKM